MPWFPSHIFVSFLFIKLCSISLIVAQYKYFSLWEAVRWKGYAQKSELNQIFKYLGPHTRTLHIEGGDRYSGNDPNINNLYTRGCGKRTAISSGRKTKKPNRNKRIIDITDSFLSRIRLNCVNLELISFQSCKIDYFSR